MKKNVIIIGAAGRDFHNFNLVYRDNEAFEVVAFTATQIPKIEGRVYPPELAGPLYPSGIPIRPERDLEKLVRELKVNGCGVFLDLKFHDIPNTVADAATAATALGVDFFDVHASGGYEMMRAAVQASREEAERRGTTPPKILAITVLTSMSSTVDEVLALATRAREAGVHGVVSSAWEAKALRDRLGPEMLIVTPGIRPSWAVTKLMLAWGRRPPCS